LTYLTKIIKMKISELIRQLKYQQSELGDVEVFYCDLGGYCDISIIREETNNINNTKHVILFC